MGVGKRNDGGNEMIWKIIVIMGDTKLTYSVTDFTERDGRILFKDRVTKESCNYPKEKCFIRGGYRE